jgi:hypothetical protein
MLNSGSTLQQYAEKVGVNYRTALRDKQEVRGLLTRQFSDSVEEYRKAQQEELETLREELIGLKEKAQEIPDLETRLQMHGALIEQHLKIMDREMRLVGTDKSHNRFGSLPQGEDGVITEIKITVADHQGQHQLPPGQVVHSLPPALEEEKPEELRLED